MLVIMNREATDEQIDYVVATIKRLGFSAHAIPGATRTAIGITGNNGPIDKNLIESLPGVIQTIRVTKPFKLVSRETKPEDTIIDIHGVKVGGKNLVIIAGPCSVESREQILSAAKLAGQVLKATPAAQVAWVEADELWTYVAKKKMIAGSGGLLIVLPSASLGGRWGIVEPRQRSGWMRNFLTPPTSPSPPTSGTPTEKSLAKSTTSKAKPTPSPSKA